MTQERDTDVSTNVEETTPEPSKPLSTDEDRRQALEQAIVSTRQVEAAEKAPVREADPEPQVEKKPEPQQLPPLQAPSEFSNDEKEDFYASSRKSQEAQLRLHRGRTQAFSREFGSTKKLTDNVRSYLDVMGKRGLSPEEAIQKAVSLYHEFDEKPEEALREFAKAKKVDLAKLLEERAEASPAQAQNLAGQERIDRLESWIEQETRSRQAHSLGQVWSRMEGSLNAAGSKRFPDLNDTESGITLASKIGTLIRNPEFQRAVQERIPGATIDHVVVEAYRWHGGRVDDSETASRSQSSQSQQIAKSRRASASVPGRGAQTGASTGGKKFSNYRDAAAAALAQIREAEGS